MYAIGIDTGSVATKGVLFDGTGILRHVILPTGWSPKQASEEALAQLLAGEYRREDVYIVSTGYGSRSIAFADRSITEITCHAKGAHFLNNAVRTIIDIGGQDSKAISVNEQGDVVDFLMNDKCAAGTGRFLEVMMNLLGSDLSEVDAMTRNAEPEMINAMCTVFAESEVIGLLAKGSSKESVAAGIVKAIAQRTAALAAKVNLQDLILFTGGLAKSVQIREEIGKRLGKTILTSEHSQLAGALGAAVIGWKKSGKSAMPIDRL